MISLAWGKLSQRNNTPNGTCSNPSCQNPYVFIYFDDFIEKEDVAITVYYPEDIYLVKQIMMQVDRIIVEK
ncbi:hypothetical protein KSF_085860 [Reticulibacter mediterranei]|uniref:Uncharacterized protein n=1 Tax=Reticulibacter mediterranei TaxID=2778369 RepID=A0A8J3IQT5_9CHLR|nr:hypothetical protein KSF_085860 [Reticulibacter mediterranei]